MAILARRVHQAAPADWSEVQLVRRVVRGDEVAWRELSRRYRNLIYRCITKIVMRYDSVLSSADPDEIYGEVLLALVRDDYHRLRLWDPRKGTKLGSWLGMISNNVSYDFLRVTARRPILDRIDGDPEVLDEARSPLENVLAAEQRREVEALLDGYSDKDRTFVTLYYGHGLSPEEVASEMDIHVKTVYSKKHKLLARLQRQAARQALVAA